MVIARRGKGQVVIARDWLIDGDCKKARRACGDCKENKW